MKITVLALVCIVLLLPQVFAQRSGSITALSVIDENETRGGLATVHLEIRPGTGAVYIESYPLTKLDTQLATREAKEIACARSTTDCTQYDFFYLIDVGASLIGGPSAGGATTVLTYAVLEGLPLDNHTAMTGSIMSGGLIGPVGGVRAKVDAAAREGFTQVLIPRWEGNASNLSGRTDIQVTPITSLDEAIQAFTGTPPHTYDNVTPPSGYTDAMQQVSASLCEHATILLRSLEKGNSTNSSTQALTYGRAAAERGAYYTSASQCFSSALISQRALLADADEQTRENVLKQVSRDLHRLDDAVQEQSPQTIADLEVQLIVTERLADVEAELITLQKDPSADTIAYMAERMETASAWYSVYGRVESRPLDITEERLLISCRRKLEEAQERVNYLIYLFPGFTGNLEQNLQQALESAQQGKSTLCLLQAAQTKAEASALVTALYVPEEYLSQVVQAKLDASERQLSAQAERDVFPILGYSYREYSEELLLREPYSASLYAEYSLELGNLDIYFPPKKPIWRIDTILLGTLLIGIAIGSVLTSIAFVVWRERHQPKKVPIARNLPGKKR